MPENQIIMAYTDQVRFQGSAKMYGNKLIPKYIPQCFPSLLNHK